MIPRTARRGQATVELALGSIVFITVLLFGIHFAEAGWLSLKVHEAANSALWEATAPRHQRMYPFYDDQPFDALFAAGTGVADVATDRYADFDGVGTVSGVKKITLATTRGTALAVTCNKEPALRWRGTASITASNTYQNSGGMSCNAEALFETVGVPDTFLEGSGGFFGAAHERPGKQKFCGFGPRVGNGAGAQCTGAIELLVNDWGLAGVTDSFDHQMPEIGCSGAAIVYCDATRRNFNGPGAAALAFATKYAGAPPTSGLDFNFAFSGVEHDYLSPVADHRGNTSYNTGGPGMGFLPPRTATQQFLGK
ncbi:MAG: pilus assembly protein [Myxococcaceae bacterium]|nr:pilus assembly protein [Myxococcaceae bacterium]